MKIDHTTHEQLERSLKDINWDTLRSSKYRPSPPAWEDQVLYFLMLDRFSDDKEQGYRDIAGNLVATGTTPRFRFPVDAYKADRAAWTDSGDEWLGGTLQGLNSKIGYLKRLGVTASGSAPYSNKWHRISIPTTATVSRTSSMWIPTSVPARTSSTW